MQADGSGLSVQADGCLARDTDPGAPGIPGPVLKSPKTEKTLNPKCSLATSAHQPASLHEGVSRELEG